ncbi:MAG: hypothetical protein WCL49_01715 [bacterium]
MINRFLAQTNIITTMAITGALMLAIAGGCKPSEPTLPTSKNASQAGPLGYGWVFASAITNDEIDLSDRCLAQKAVALAYLAEGNVEMAQACALQIEDYNRGMVLAAIAEWLVTHGEPSKAEALLPALEACGFVAKDWQREYISSAIIRIQALLGKEQTVVKSAARFNNRSSIGGDVAANLALVLARTGRVDEATGILKNLTQTNGLNTSDSSVKGYLDIATLGKLDQGAVTQALVKAWEAAGTIKPPRRWDLQLQVIDAMTKQGMSSDALQRLALISTTITTAVKLPPEVHAAMLCQCALLWKNLGQPKNAEGLRSEAEKTIARKLEVIFQPGAYAVIGTMYADTGDLTQAREWYGRALDVAAGLENRRPRAQAGVEVCESLAKHKEVIDAGIQKRLERLNGTFDAAKP